MIKLFNILEQERFSYFKILNNKVNLDRGVSTVDSAETPDVYNYIPPNTFLVTTGMIYKDNQKSLSLLIEKLDQIGTSALAIKLGRFITEVDPEVIATCDRLGFPLLLIPENMTLGDILLQILSYVWDNKNDELSYAFNIQKKFYDLALKDSSVNVLVKSLSHTLKKDIALIDPFGNISCLSNEENKKYYKRSIRNIIEKISENPRSTTNFDRTIKDYEDKDMNISIYPINISHYYPYYLIVFHSEDLAFPISKMVIEQATLVLAFKLYKDLRASYNTIIDRESFVKDLLSLDTFKGLSNPQIVAIGYKYGLILASSYKAILMSIRDLDELSSRFSYRDELYTLIYEWLNRKINKDLNNVALFPNREDYRFILVVQNDSKDIEEYLKSFRTILKKTLRLDTVFSMGENTSLLEDLKYSYREAREAVLNGETRNNIDYIKYYTPIETGDLFRFIPKTQGEIFSKSILKTLASPETQSQKDLRETLKVYLDLSYDITKTAEKLFIHRNTVSYRIKKCEEILGKPLDDPEFNLGLRLSLVLTEK
nr:PucR family transcriptional regulator [Tissierella sp.]